MKFARLAVVAGVWNRIRALTILLLAVFLASSCSNVNIEAAKSLGAAGRDVASQMQQNVLASDKEYLRTRDCVALVHGFSGTTNSGSYKQLLELYDDVYQELAQRSAVFEKLASLYDEFGELAGLDGGERTEKALGDLSTAINGYAKRVLKREAPISSDTTAVISKIGGLAAAEIQKAKIKEASIQIQARVGVFLKLFEDPLIRAQMTGFRGVMASDRKTALVILWDEGVYEYDPKSMLDDLGAEAGLVAREDAAELVKSNPKLDSALREVFDKRLSRGGQLELVERGYDSSLSALRRLISEHKKLEQGEPLDLARLRAVAAELRGIAVLLAKDKGDVLIGQ